jgi:hypothetical protein
LLKKSSCNKLKLARKLPRKSYPQAKVIHRLEKLYTSANEPKVIHRLESYPQV